MGSHADGTLSEQSDSRFLTGLGRLFDERVMGLLALIALDEHEAPGAQPTVIGRAHCGLQHDGEVLRGRRSVAKGFGGAARNERFDGVHGVRVLSDERVIDVLHVIILFESVDELQDFGGLRFR